MAGSFPKNFNLISVCMLPSDREDVFMLHIQQDSHGYVGKQLPFLGRKF